MAYFYKMRFVRRIPAEIKPPIRREFSEWRKILLRRRLRLWKPMMSKGLGDLFKDIDELLQPAEEFVEEIGK